MEGGFLIYGATGYTGRLVVQQAIRLGLRPVLGGRDARKLATQAEALGLEYRVAELMDPDGLRAALRGIDVVLHAAGPFSRTSHPMLEACLQTRTHYLDITAEVAVIEALAHRDADARRRQIVIMPAVGFDVVPSDCLAAHVAARLPSARRLAVGVAGLTFATRGSAKTLVEHAGHGGVRVRRDGEITAVGAGLLEYAFDYGDGPRQSVNVGWGDVATAYYTTGIPNIEVYFEATSVLRSMLSASRYLGWALRTAPAQVFLKAWSDLLPEGPDRDIREGHATVIVVEATDDGGRRAVARLRAPEAYTLTALTASAIAARVWDGDWEAGFQTPGRLYGADFVLSFDGVSREDLA